MGPRKIPEAVCACCCRTPASGTVNGTRKTPEGVREVQKISGGYGTVEFSGHASLLGEAYASG